MKKIFTLMMVCMATLGMQAQDTWTVAGTSNICGSSWNPADTNNDMTSTDGTNFTLVKQGVILESGVKAEFKVVKNHDWNNGSYPASNYNFTVQETGTYTVTISFNTTTQEVNAESIKTGEAVIGEKTWTIAGASTLMGNEWKQDDANHDMVKQDDGSYTLTLNDVKLLADIEYEYKVCANHGWDEAYPDAGNAKLSVTKDGYYDITFTFKPEDKSILADAVFDADATAAGINNVKNVEKLTIIYNLQGQRVENGYRGIAIKNGRKMIVK